MHEGTLSESSEAVMHRRLSSPTVVVVLIMLQGSVALYMLQTFLIGLESTDYYCLGLE